MRLAGRGDRGNRHGALRRIPEVRRAAPQVDPVHDPRRSALPGFYRECGGSTLNKASRALLIDPTNGAGDIERKELRAVHNYSFYDDPSRMLRLIRFKVRLGYAIDDRTRLQYENAREAEMLTRICPEPRERTAPHGREPNAADLVKALEEEKLIEIYSPALAGPKLNLPIFAKLQKARQLAPFGMDLRLNSLALFWRSCWKS